MIYSPFPEHHFQNIMDIVPVYSLYFYIWVCCISYSSPLQPIGFCRVHLLNFCWSRGEARLSNSYVTPLWNGTCFTLEKKGQLWMNTRAALIWENVKKEKSEGSSLCVMETWAWAFASLSVVSSVWEENKTNQPYEGCCSVWSPQKQAPFSTGIIPSKAGLCNLSLPQCWKHTGIKHRLQLFLILLNVIPLSSLGWIYTALTNCKVIKQGFKALRDFLISKQLLCNHIPWSLKERRGRGTHTLLS